MHCPVTLLSSANNCGMHACVAAVTMLPLLQESERQVSTSQGHDFARKMGCLYVETSAKTNVAGMVQLGSIMEQGTVADV